MQGFFYANVTSMRHLKATSMPALTDLGNVAHKFRIVSVFGNSESIKNLKYENACGYCRYIATINSYPGWNLNIPQLCGICPGAWTFVDIINNQIVHRGII